MSNSFKASGSKASGRWPSWLAGGARITLLGAATALLGVCLLAYAGPPEASSDAPPPKGAGDADAAQTERFQRMLMDDAPDGPDAPGAPDRPRRGPRSRDGQRGGDRTLTNEQIDQVIMILEKVRPEEAPKVRALREREGADAGKAVARQYPRMVMFLEMRQRAPEMFDLRLDDLELNRLSRELADAYRTARDAGRLDEAQAAKEKLLANVKKHFVIREQIRERELAMLEQRIADLRNELAERKKLEQQIIADRVRELTGEDETQW